MGGEARRPVPRLPVSPGQRAATGSLETVRLAAAVLLIIGQARRLRRRRRLADTASTAVATAPAETGNEPTGRGSPADPTPTGPSRHRSPAAPTGRGIASPAWAAAGGRRPADRSLGLHSVAPASLLLALAAGAAAARAPGVLVAVFLTGPTLALLTKAGGRLLIVLTGALLVFQSSSGVGAEKLAFIAVFALCTAISAVRVHRLLKQDWAASFRPVVLTGVGYLGYLLLTALVAHRNGSSLNLWLRDVLAYALLAVCPLIAVDAASTLTLRATRRLLVTLGLVVPFAFSSDWLARRDVATLPTAHLVLATFALAIVPFAYSLVRASVGPHRVRWLMLTAYMFAVLLLSGSRSNLVLSVGLLGVVGSRAKVRLNGARAVVLSITFTALGAGALLWLAKVTGQGKFLRERADLATQFVNSGKDQSAALRRRGYSISLDAFHARPLLGTGPGHIFPAEVPTLPGSLSLDSPLMIPAKFGILGTLVLLVFLSSIVLTFHRARRRAGWSVAGTTGRVTAVVVLALTPFGPVPEDKGFSLGIMVLLFLLGTELRATLAAEAEPDPPSPLTTSLVPPLAQEPDPRAAELVGATSLRAGTETLSLPDLDTQVPSPGR